ncbi:hypothetical protein H632_c438p2 [Helicosporidium sp. ATCC 50920]|nr:hypothetical protein H632_c438p2 [Helicosporidium sp. ATCC 50920]|eukprot:KDD75918.1 hypothetical protein H632_c438p2 [Helicosporidium sp. ATCC 50920]
MQSSAHAVHDSTAIALIEYIKAIEIIGCIMYGQYVSGDDAVGLNFDGRLHSHSSHPIERAKGVDKVFEESFGAYNGRAFGIGGDQSAHLLWRVLHSELAPHAGPQVVILNIGTNDLGNARAGTTAATERQALLDAVDGILDRVSSIVAVLRRHLPGSFIVLSSLLPRAGEGARRFAQPSAYTESLGAVNAQFQAMAGRDRVVYRECAHVLLNGSGDIEPALLPDGVHPSPAGYALLAKCYLEAVKELIGDPQPRPGREEVGAEAAVARRVESAGVRLGLLPEADGSGAEDKSAVTSRRALLA